MEVHVHGNLYLSKGVTRAQIEAVLHPWLDYLDVDNLTAARSLEPDEPGMAFDEASRTLEICWTGEIEQAFQFNLEQALQALGPYTEQATEIEVSYYHDNGNDELQLVFVGPNAESIHEAQRSRMVEDVGSMLSRHFSPDAIEEVVSLLNDLFDRDWADKVSRGETAPVLPRDIPSRKYLH